MKKHVNNNFVILFVAIFSISINAEYRLGLDYTIVDNPLPVKKDGIVEVTAVSYTHLTLPTIDPV